MKLFLANMGPIGIMLLLIIAVLIIWKFSRKPKPISDTNGDGVIDENDQAPDSHDPGMIMDEILEFITQVIAMSDKIIELTIDTMAGKKSLYTMDEIIDDVVFTVIKVIKMNPIEYDSAINIINLIGEEKIRSQMRPVIKNIIVNSMDRIDAALKDKDTQEESSEESDDEEESE